MTDIAPWPEVDAKKGIGRNPERPDVSEGFVLLSLEKNPAF